MGILLTAEELFQIAAQLESYGQSYYLELADVTDVPKLKEIYNLLAAEEERHYQLFTEYYQQATQKKWQLARVDEETAEYIEALMGIRMFQPEKDIAREVAAIQSPHDALDQALAFEKNSLLFFHRLLEMIGSELCPAIRKIIAEERDHITLLQAMLAETP